MIKPGPNLWWSYNAEDNQFSPLPAGPFLVPALIIATIASLFGQGQVPVQDFEANAGSLVDSPEWQARRLRYEELAERYLTDYDGMSWPEIAEYKRLKRYLETPHGQFINKEFNDETSNTGIH